MQEVPSGLAAVAKKLGAVCRAVPEEEYGMPVAASAAGLPAMKKPEGSISEPFLVFVSFPEGARFRGFCARHVRRHKRDRS